VVKAVAATVLKAKVAKVVKAVVATVLKAKEAKVAKAVVVIVLKAKAAKVVKAVAATVLKVAKVAKAVANKAKATKAVAVIVLKVLKVLKVVERPIPAMANGLHGDSASHPVTMPVRVLLNSQKKPILSTTTFFNYLIFIYSKLLSYLFLFKLYLLPIYSS